MNFPYILLFIVCPRRFPQIEVHPGKKKHGDVCRKSSQNKNYRCPKGCFKTPKGRSPFCQMSPSNKAPCRLVCEDNFPRLETFSDPSEHGNVCRKQNNNNYRCPRGCRKTKNGMVPFCSTLNNPSKPCRKQWISKEIHSKSIFTHKNWYNLNTLHE